MPLFFGLFLIVDLKMKSQYFTNFNSFSLFFSLNTCDIQFRYSSATFGGTAMMMLPLLGIIFRFILAK
jgi:hypothetical protein